jgi:hypothetical protein
MYVCTHDLTMYAVNKRIKVRTQDLMTYDSKGGTDGKRRERTY